MLRARLVRCALMLAAAVLAACGDDDDPTGTSINPPLGLSVTATGATTTRVTFNSAAGDNSYVIERAEAASGTFASAGTVQAPATPGVVTFDDTGLQPSTAYRYRVAAVRGSQQSSFTAEQSATTKGPGENATKDVVGDITTNTTWHVDTTYLIKGFAHVANGATLTIEAGTRIQGDFNTLGASLFVLRGAKIIAQGTATQPIVFTSSRPAGQRQPGDWGGVVIVGNATDARTGVEIEVEGTNQVAGNAPGTNYKVTYHGGTTDTDNSGELRYVRVEFAGFAISNGNELNSFTFAAVGSGTRLSYLQAMAGLDDSFEWFGGTVDGDHLVSYETGDDHFDMSEGFRGRLQYLIAFQSTVLTQRSGSGSPASDPQGIENDGCPSTSAGCTLGHNTTPFTTPVVANFTMVGTGDAASSGTTGGVGLLVRRGSGGYYLNGLLARWPRGAFSIRDPETYVRAGSVTVPDLATADLAMRNILFAETSTAFQTGTGQSGSFDLAANALVQEAGATSTLFTAFPATVSGTTTAAAFDWTPPAGSAAASGGMATFTGKLAAAAGTAVAGTSYRGAAQPGGAKWWQGWTVYARN
jgi:hypothetical protein